MLTNQIRFDDGAIYERYMGKWSQLAGEIFLDCGIGFTLPVMDYLLRE